MNLTLLLAGLQIWKASSLVRLSILFCAVSVLSIEMQIVTWSAVGSLRHLAFFNGALTTLLIVGPRQWTQRIHATLEQLGPPTPGDDSRRGLPDVIAIFTMGALVIILNVGLPLTPADPYHLDRVAQIERLGTLAYDPAAHPTVNVLGGLYELLLADVQQIPFAGSDILRLHGVGNLLMYLLTLAVIFRVTGTSARWAFAFLLTVPVVFHQFVLVKNDLFGAVPALLVLTWLAVRMPFATPLEYGWAAWITGVALGTKLTNFPLALIAAAAVLLSRRTDRRALVCAACGAVAGLLASGILLTLTENVRLYGDMLAPFQIGDRTKGVMDSLISIGRFGISLFDLGLFTRTWWPNRGGWGSTFGLPLIWAVAVFACCARRDGEMRRALAIAVVYWLVAAAVHTDVDIAHRRVLAPGLLLIVMAVARVSRGAVPVSLLRSVGPVMVLSAAQIARSAALYFTR